MEERTVDRYQKLAIWFHWIHAAAFVILVLTGAVVFLPGTTVGSEGPGIVHRVVAVIFIAAPIAYCFFKTNRALQFIKESITWNRDDFEWLKAAPSYYFGGPEENMPPQGYINTGQKMWQLVIFGTSLIFLITGAIMWFFKHYIPLEAYQWTLFAHGIAFILVFVMFLAHIYMGILHPRMSESLRSMKDGKISPTYARSHYRKWYDSIQKKEGRKTAT